MANKYIIDTHALVWYLEGNSRLGQQAKATMDAADIVAPVANFSGQLKQGR